ncbi:polyprenyl diphosphate synthase [SAR86 cluster bacterium]|nr:polyprenyl diphosphate synthase [SAR86 cluster bacterium]
MLNLPAHIAIIMDGNSRWAADRGFSKNQGHKEGVKKARMAVEFARNNKIKHLTLFAFSTENWGRQKKEVKGLLKIFLQAFTDQTPDLIKNKVKLDFIGDIPRFDKLLINKIKESQLSTSKYSPELNLHIAISYGGKWDLMQALVKINSDIISKKISKNQVDEDLISKYLVTNNIPDPDLIIRTGNEQRISNFFLWQAAYSELFFSKKLWPDFEDKDFSKALKEFENRKRKFGVITGN